MFLVMLPVPPLAAVITGFFMVAAPFIILMTVWTLVTMARILFPERELPFDPSARREQARQRGEAVPVQFRDLMDDQRQRRARAPAMPTRAPTSANSTPEVTSALAEDLWLRRN